MKAPLLTKLQLCNTLSFLQYTVHRNAERNAETEGNAVPAEVLATASPEHAEAVPEEDSSEFEIFYQIQRESSVCDLQRNRGCDERIQPAPSSSEQTLGEIWTAGG